MPRKKKEVVFGDLAPDVQARLMRQVREEVWQDVYIAHKKERAETALQMKRWSSDPTSSAVAAAAAYREYTRQSLTKDVKILFKKVIKRFGYKEKIDMDFSSPVRKLGINITPEGDIYGLRPPYAR